MTPQAQDPFAAVRRCDRVLVYGTLKRGQRNHGVIGDVRRLAAARTASGFRLYLGEIPAVDRAGSASVEGDLVAVTGAQLRRMDEFEGHPSFFRRELVTLADGGAAWMYLHPVPPRAAPRHIVADGVAAWPQGRPPARGAS